jgi:ABC-2 type transport system permease protein
VTQQGRDKRPGASADGVRTVPFGPLRRVVLVCRDFTQQVLVITWIETRKIRRDPMELLTRAVQPVLWLGIFGVVMNRARAIPTGNLSYLDFMVPGILSQSVLFIAIFYGIALIWEKDLGLLHKFLVSPAYRGALVTGKAVSAGLRAMSQAVIVCLLGFFMGAHLRFTPLALSGMLLFIMLGAAIFSTFSLIIACIVKTRERFMGIGQVLTMPLFFASNAIYPLSLMPDWLKVVARANPLTYQVDALRALMIQGGQSTLGLGVDLLVEVLVLIGLIALGSWMYPKAIR